MSAFGAFTNASMQGDPFRAAEHALAPDEGIAVVEWAYRGALATYCFESDVGDDVFEAGKAVCVACSIGIEELFADQLGAVDSVTEDEGHFA